MYEVIYIYTFLNKNADYFLCVFRFSFFSWTQKLQNTYFVKTRVKCSVTALTSIFIDNFIVIQCTAGVQRKKSTELRYEDFG